MLFFPIPEITEALMKSSALLSALLICALSPSYASADFYRWVDNDGRENYTNDLEKVPLEYRDRLAKVEIREDRVSVGKGLEAGKKRAPGYAEHKDKYGRGENYWRRKVENLRRELRRLEDEYDLILRQEREEGQPQGLINKKKKIIAARNRRKAELEKKIARKRYEIDVELPEQARKADAYPGWIRE